MPDSAEKIKKNRNAQLLSMATAGRSLNIASKLDFILKFYRPWLRCRSLTVKVPLRTSCAVGCPSHTHASVSVSVVLMYALRAHWLCIMHRIGSLALGLRTETVTLSVLLERGDSKKARCQLGTSGRCAAWAARWRRGAWSGVRMSVPCGDPTAPLLAPRPTSACQSRLGLSRLGWDGVCTQACLQKQCKQCKQCKPCHTCDMGTEANFVRLAASRCWPRTPELHEIGGRTPPTLLEARRIAYACAFACVKRREPRNPHGCRDS